MAFATCLLRKVGSEFAELVRLVTEGTDGGWAEFSGITAWGDDKYPGLTGETDWRQVAVAPFHISYQAAVLRLHRLQTEHRSIYSEVARQ